MLTFLDSEKEKSKMMFYLLAPIAFSSQNNFDYKKASIITALVLVLHCFSSKSFAVLRASIFLRLLPSDLVPGASALVVVLGLALTELIACRRLKLFIIFIILCFLSTLIRRSI